MKKEWIHSNISNLWKCLLCLRISGTGGHPAYFNIHQDNRIKRTGCVAWICWTSFKRLCKACHFRDLNSADLAMEGGSFQHHKSRLCHIPLRLNGKVHGDPGAGLRRRLLPLQKAGSVTDDDECVLFSFCACYSKLLGLYNIMRLWCRNLLTVKRSHVWKQAKKKPLTQWYSIVQFNHFTCSVPTPD